MAAHRIGPFIDFGRVIGISTHRRFLDVAAGNCGVVNRYSSRATLQTAREPQVGTMAAIKNQIA